MIQQELQHMYLDILLIAKYRYAVTRLRTSSHRLAIETGRWTKPHSTPRFERKCQLCNTLEDEFHFMLECWNRTNMHQFIELFKSDNSIVVINVTTYVQKSMEKRTFFYI